MSTATTKTLGDAGLVAMRHIRTGPGQMSEWEPLGPNLVSGLDNGGQGTTPEASGAGEPFVLDLSDLGEGEGDNWLNGGDA